MSRQTHEGKPIVETSAVHPAIENLINIYNARAMFFTDMFVRKVQARDRKALSEITRHPLPPTPMDLRIELAKCLQSGVSDDCLLSMKDGKVYSIGQLKQLVPNWAAIAEQALIASDPALADKLMSVVQWNAKSAFEVTFVTAVNELKEIVKSKNVSLDMEHYSKWILNPLERALEHVREVNPPDNSLVGYGQRIPLREAMEKATNLRNEFRRAIEKKKR